MYQEVKNILLSHPTDEERTEQQRQLIIKALQLIPFFSTQDSFFLRECQKFLRVSISIINMFKIETVDSKQIIFKSGDKGDKLYIVLEGEVEIYKPIVVCEPNMKNQILSFNPNMSEQQAKKLSRRRSYLKHIDLELERHFNLTHQKIAKCEAGSCFGEIAIIMNKARTATVKATNMMVFLATLDKNSYRQIFLHSTSELDNKLKYIEKIFPNVHQNVLIRISYDFILKEFVHNSYIYKENERPDYFYFLLTGEVRLEYQKNKHPEKQTLLRPKPKLPKIIHLTILQKDAIFGLEEILENAPRKSTARVISQYCLTYAVPRSSLVDFDKKDNSNEVLSFLEKQARIKQDFYEDKFKQVSQIEQQIQRNLSRRITQKNLPKKSFRKFIEQEKEFHQIVKNLNNEEIQILNEKASLNLPENNISPTLKTKHQRFDDMERKKRLLAHFLNTQHISKNEESDSYFNYQKKIYQNSGKQKKCLTDQSEESLSFSNPFFQTKQFQLSPSSKNISTFFNSKTTSVSPTLYRLKKRIDELTNRESIFYFQQSSPTTKSPLFF